MRHHVIIRALALVALLAGFAGTARAQYLYWIDTVYGTPMLSRAQVYGQFRSDLALPAGSLPEGLAFSASQGRLVIGESAWSGAALRGTSTTLVPPVALVTGLSCVRGVAAHAATGDLYWTTSNLLNGSSVQRSNSAGGSVTTLLSLGTVPNLRGIAIDEAGGKLYFADFDQNLILSSNLDGTGLATFLNLGPSHGPWGLCIDAVARQLYWCEYVWGRTCRVSLSGGAPEVLFSGLGNPTYITLIPDPNAPDGVYPVWSEAAAGAQRIALGIIGQGAYTAALGVSAYGGLAYVPGAALDAGLPLAVTELALAPVSPNPATEASVVEFAVPSATRVRVTLCDVQGRRVAELFDGVANAGRHSVPLAAAWAAHRRVAGVYFLRLEADGRSLTRKVAIAP